jgi:MerR family transcriptional regulator, redox-sensitive transcriptional activator SoxR
MNDDLLTIGEVASRAGVSTPTLRFYERERLITSLRSDGNQRRYRRDVLRRVAFIRAAQRVGLSLEEIRAELAALPDRRTPTKADWARVSKGWRPRVEAEIRRLERLRDELTECIGCGCLSFRACALYNPDDAAARNGPGARYLIGDDPTSTRAGAPGTFVG